MSNSHRINKRTVLYGREWAEERVAEFVNDYPRACLIFRQVTNHAWDFPVELLMRNSLKWERYKKIIKRIASIDVRMKTPLICKEYTRLIQEEHLPKIIAEVKAEQLFAPKS